MSGMTDLEYLKAEIKNGDSLWLVLWLYEMSEKELEANQEDPFQPRQLYWVIEYNVFKDYRGIFFLTRDSKKEMQKYNSIEEIALKAAIEGIVCVKWKNYSKNNIYFNPSASSPDMIIGLEGLKVIQ